MYIITRQYLISLKKRAIRTGKWFRLDKFKQAALELAIKTLKYVKSQILINLILEIIKFIDHQKYFLIEAYNIGLEIVKNRVKQAKQIGYHKADKWLKDKEYILQVGIGILNIPLYYRP